MTETASTPQNAAAGPAAKAALYLRVSTGRQADSDLSIPDQRRQITSYCAAKGWDVTAEFVEPGNTATDDRRPAFQAMIDAALIKPPGFTIIIVHSFSRFFRDQFQFEFYVRKLAKNGVRLISITQDLGDDPMSVMMRQIMTLFDEYQSKENAKHTLRAMKENARQGYWNGALPPIGYRTVAAGQRGTKIKKKLEIDPIHADTVRLIYRLALTGDGQNGPMGIKSIATYLNDHNIRTRDGGKFGVASIHQILTRTTYIGQHKYNHRSYRTKVLKPESEHAIMAVPPIVTAAEFHSVQTALKSRSPQWMAPRAVSGPTLLTGICFCASCGGAMTLRTGKGSAGGIYKYYTCSTKARQGASGCRGLTVPMEKLDRAVVDYLEWRLLDPQRLAKMMDQLLERREEWNERRRSHITELRKRSAEAAAKLKRIYEAIEDGVVNVADPSLKDRIAELTAIRDQAQLDAERSAASIERLGPAITPESLRRFALAARRKLRNKDGTYRRDHLRALAQRVEVVDQTQIRILGAKTELLRTLAMGVSVESAALGVRSFVPKWRPREDSNLRPPV